MPCVVRDSGWAADLAWAKSVRALPAPSSPADMARALDDVVTKKPKVAKLRRDFTLDGMLDDLTRLYDDLAGVPGHTEEERREMGRRMARGRRRRYLSSAGSSSPPDKP